MDVSMLKDNGSFAPAAPCDMQGFGEPCLKAYPGKKRIKTFTILNWFDQQPEAIAHIVLLQREAFVLMRDLVAKLGCGRPSEFRILGPIPILSPE